MKKLLPLLVIVSLLVPASVRAYTVTTNRPRIWIEPGDVAGIAADAYTAGKAQTQYAAVKSWVDSHINDSPSGISQDVGYRTCDHAAYNMAYHLMNTSLVYLVEKERASSGYAAYGQRVADLLYYLANSGSGVYSHSAGSGDDYGMSYPSLAVAYDWCRDQLNYAGHLATISDYLSDIASSAVTSNTCKHWTDSNYEPRKTEEPWQAGTIALSIYGESGIAMSNVNELILRYDHWVRDYLGRYEESGVDGSVCIGGSYHYDQNQWHHSTYAKALSTATDQDLFHTTDPITQYVDPTPNDGSEYLRNACFWAVVTMRPDGWKPRMGDGSGATAGTNGRYDNAFCNLLAKEAQDPVAQYYHEISYQIDPNYNLTGYCANKHLRNFFWTIWRDHDLTPSVSGLPEAYAFTADDSFVMRSGYDYVNSTDIWIYGMTMKKHDYYHWGSDVGAFQMARGGDWLLINAGQYSYGADYSINFDEEYWSQNAIWINNERPYVYGQEAAGRLRGYNPSYAPHASQNDYAGLINFQQQNDDYAYIVMDLDDNYTNASKVRRNFVFIDDKWLVLYDDIEKSTASHQAKVAYQVSDEPVAPDNDWGAISGCTSDRTNITNWRANTGSSRLWYRLLSPTSGVTMRQVGGSGCYTTDQNYTNHGGSTTSWRVEVFSTASNANDRYLQVLQPVASTASETPNNLIATIDSDFIGAEIKGSTTSIVLFSKDGTDQDNASFTTSVNSGTMKAVVANLSEGTYNVNGSGSYDVDSDGVLYFTANLSSTNSFTISTGTGTGSPPSQALSPYPEDGATNEDLSLTLAWIGDVASYDVYLGTDSTPDSGELVSSGQTETNYDTGTLLPGTRYYWRIDSTNAYGTTIGDVWEFETVSAPPPVPAISRTPTSLSNSCTEGSDAASQTFEVWNSGGGTLSYAISDNRTWLSVSPSSGTSTGEHDTITVNYNTSGLAAGTYSGTITITDTSGSASAQTIVLSITVSAPPPVPAISRTPTSLSNSCTEGSDAASQTFEVWNSGGGTLSYAISDNRTWLSVSPSSGTSTGEHDTITVNYNTSGLAAGTYSGTITITDTSGSASAQTIALSITVSAPPPVPAISRTPTSLSNSCTEGSDAASQTFEVWNSGGGTLSYVISDNRTWLSVSPSSGTSTGEHDTITVNYNTSGLAAGTYPGTITITDTSGSASAQTIALSITVSAPPPVPAISRTPTSLSNSCTEGSDAASQTFEVWNSGGGTLSYAISDNRTWLSVSPSSGTSTGEHDTITVNYNTSGLAAGTYSGTITITDTSGSASAQTIALSITVSAPPPVPAISRTPTSLSNSCTEGSDAASQTFEVWNSGGGTLSYAISDNRTWLSVSPSSGTSTGEHDTITVNYNTSGLAAGTYPGTITISDPNAGNDSQIVSVSLTVDAPSNLAPSTPVITSPYYGEMETDLLLSVQTEPFSDPDGDTHSKSQWQIIKQVDSSVVLDITSSEHLTELPIPHLVLDRSTTYLVSVQFYDSYSEPSEWSDLVQFTTTSDTVDFGGDGIPDDWEVDDTVDLNQDSIPDNDQPDLIKSVKSAVGSNQPIAVSKISAAIDTIEVLEPVNPAEILEKRNKPETFLFGLACYRLRVNQPGATALVRIYHSTDISNADRFYMYDTINGWEDYTRYTTFNPDGKSVTIELKDGAHGDSDGVANGIIVDPGGITGVVTSGLDSGASSSSCFIGTASSSSYMDPQVKRQATSYTEEHDWLKPIICVLRMPRVGISYILVRTSLATMILIGLLLIISVINFYTLVYRREKYQA